jgi:transposase
MAGKTKDMGDIRQVLMLHQAGYSNRQIARETPINKETVNNYMKTVSELKLDIAALLRMEDPELERMFHQGNPAYTDERMDVFIKELPYYKEQLKDKHVTRLLLWEEYKQRHPNGYGKSQFFFHLKQNLVAAKAPTAVLTYTYDPGLYLFVDYAGDKLEYIDSETGEIIQVEVFVAALPYSDYEFAFCVPSQKLEDYLYAMRRCFEFIDGVPKIVVCDNLKAAVIKASHYEPTLNRAFEDMGAFYHFAIVPCQPHSPTQKALVESAVRRVYHHVYAKLRGRTFYSLQELNAAIEKLIREHNQTRMQKRPYSREERFLAKERASLQALPEGEFEIKYYAHPKVQYNNFIELGKEKHQYSVPYQYIGQKADVIFTRSIVKIFIQGKLVATHQRSFTWGYTYVREHLASQNNAIMERSPQDFIERGARVTVNCRKYMEALFDPERTSTPPEVFYKTANMILALGRKSDYSHFDKACEVCIELNVFSGRRFESVLKGPMLMSDTKDEDNLPPTPTNHENMRGAQHYA